MKRALELAAAVALIIVGVVLLSWRPAPERRAFAQSGGQRFPQPSGSTGTTVPMLFYSPVDNAFQSASFSKGSGSQTDCSDYIFTSNATVTGIRTASSTNPPSTWSIQLTMWDATTSPYVEIAKVTVSTPPTHVVSGTFATKQTATAWHIYEFCAWETTGVAYSFTPRTGMTLLPINSVSTATDNSMAIQGGPYVLLLDTNSWGNGGLDTHATSRATSERYPVEPIFTVP